MAGTSNLIAALKGLMQLRFRWIDPWYEEIANRLSSNLIPYTIGSSLPSGPRLGEMSFVFNPTPGVGEANYLPRFFDGTTWYDMSGGGSSYTLPTASPSVLGGIKVGSGLAINGGGVLSSTVTSAPAWVDGNTLAAFRFDSTPLLDDLGQFVSTALAANSALVTNTLNGSKGYNSTTINGVTAVPLTGVSSRVSDAFYTAGGATWSIDYWAYVSNGTNSGYPVNFGDLQGYMQFQTQIGTAASVRNFSLVSTYFAGGTRTAATTFTTGWHHFAATYSYGASTLVLYVDGISTTFTGVVSTSVTRGFPLQVSLGWPGGSDTGMVIDNVRFHYGVRSAAWVASVYAAGALESPINQISTPGGSTTQVQYNNGGAFGGAAALTYDSGTSSVGLTKIRNSVANSGTNSILKLGNTNTLGGTTELLTLYSDDFVTKRTHFDYRGYLNFDLYGGGNPVIVANNGSDSAAITLGNSTITGNYNGTGAYQWFSANAYRAINAINTDAFIVQNTGARITLDNVGGNNYLYSSAGGLYQNTGTGQAFKFTINGSQVFSIDVANGLYTYLPLVAGAGGTLTIKGTNPDGASAISTIIDSASFVTAGAKLLSVRNNGIEKAYIEKDGGFWFGPGMFYNAVTGTLTLKQQGTNVTNLLEVRDAANTLQLSINQTGAHLAPAFLDPVSSLRTTGYFEAGGSVGAVSSGFFVDSTFNTSTGAAGDVLVQDTSAAVKHKKSATSGAQLPVGVAGWANAPSWFHTKGKTPVTADTGAVAIGDTLVMSTSLAGAVMTDNTGDLANNIMGYALTSKVAGSSGTVYMWQMVQPGRPALYHATNPLGRKVGVPATAASTGAVGDFAADASWFYICTATNTWMRAAIATW